MKRFFLGVLVVLVLFSLIACEKKNEVEQVSNNIETETQPQVVEDVEEITESIPKSEQIATAGSGMPLKDNEEEAKYQIKAAVLDLLKEAYGDKVLDARINVDRIYSAYDEEENEILREMNLGPDEVAFEVSYDLKPSGDTNPIELSIPNGEYDEESGWVKGNTRLGILRPNDSGEAKYKITDFGTGW